MRAAILTVSDRSHSGVRADLSGPALAKFLTERGFTVDETFLWLRADGSLCLHAAVLRHGVDELRVQLGEPASSFAFDTRAEALAALSCKLK